MTKVMKAATAALAQDCVGALKADYNTLLKHDGCSIVSIKYSNAHAALECDDCDEAILEKDYEKATEKEFYQITDHVGHDMEVIAYTDRMTIECLTCDKVVAVAKKEG